MTEPVPTFTVGQRLTVDKWKATVRYVGEVEGQIGRWIGLDWDDEERGKHEGSHNGRRYFYTDGGRKSGSFVREQKLHSSANIGQSIVSALHQKYTEQDLHQAENNGLQLNGRVRVELVGIEKLKRQRGGVERLHEVSLIDCNISSMGGTGELSQTAPSLRDIDMSSNLLSDWDEVMQLCSELQSLEILNISCNKLLIPSQPTSPTSRALRSLILNQCGLSDWKIIGLLSGLTALEELHLMGNRLHDVNIEEADWKCLSRLKKLDLDDNHISDWRQISKLGKLPNLEALMVSNNGIRSILPEEGDRFQNLRLLVVAQNEISDWASIDALHTFPKLTALRLTGNPHPANTRDERYQAIARLGGLQALNGSLISAAERRDAEVQMLRTIAGLRLRSDFDAQSAEPARLAQLQQRYGDVGAAVCSDGKPKSLRSQMLAVTLSGHNDPTQTTKSLPSSLTLGKLKALCSKLLKIPIRQQVINLMSGDEIENITDCDARQLSYFADQGKLQLQILDGG